MSKDAKAAEDGDVVPRNEFGGVYVDEEELRYKISAWQIKKTSMGNVVRNEAGEEEDVYDF